VTFAAKIAGNTVLEHRFGPLLDLTCAENKATFGLSSKHR
jgi:hypothetical protein